jgi:hypothetical protein
MNFDRNPGLFEVKVKEKRFDRLKGRKGKTTVN